MTDDLEQRWSQLDERIRDHWWDDDVVTAADGQVSTDPKETLLALPRPYVTAGGSGGSFPEMYGWDTWFINLGLFAHGRDDLVACHVENQLTMIERHGMVLNGNRTYYLTRSQPPLLADTVAALADRAGASAVPERAAQLLTQQFTGYWAAGHHATDIGLTTNRDLGDPGLSEVLAAEAETGLDFTALFGGDVRRHVPLITNAILVRYARVLERLTGDESWGAEACRRAQLISELCWDHDLGWFVEYDVVDRRRRHERSLAGWWPVWAGIATTEQVDRMAGGLADFDHGHGLAFTDRVYPSPHREFDHVQWGHPTLWPPAQIWVCQALYDHGHRSLARRIATDVVRTMIHAWERTGELWEKYHAGTGDLDLPTERYGSVPMHGWSSAAVVVLGRLAFFNEAIGSASSPVNSN